MVENTIIGNTPSHVVLDENGGFNGRVYSLRDADGEPVPQANLKVILAQHGAIIGSTTSDEDGRFSFTDLPTGVVAIMAEGENSLMLVSAVLFSHARLILRMAPCWDLSRFWILILQSSREPIWQKRNR